MRDFLARRAVPGVEQVDGSGYARTIATAGGPAVLRVRPSDGDVLEVAVDGPGGALPEAVARVRRMFDVDRDPDVVHATLGRDPLLAPLVAARPGLRIAGAWDPFECAVRAVLGQQVSVAAGLTLLRRLVTRLGRALEPPAGGFTHLFPEPAAVAAGDLDGLGLTGARRETLKSLGARVADGTVDFTAPAAEVKARLTALPGIGDWTAEYVALRGLGDADAFPAADLVLRKVAAAGGAPLTTRQLRERAERWRPLRGYAVLYLWQAATDADARRGASAP